MFGGIGWGLLEFLTVLIEEMPEQERNFRGPLPERWNINGKDIQSIVKILAQAAGFHGLLNLYVGGGEHSHVNANHVAPTEPRVLMILKHMQELRLQMGTHLSDLVQKNRALIRQFKFAWLRTHRSRKRALLVAEQLGLQQLAGEGGAVDLDERLIAAGRKPLGGSPGGFFSPPAFAAHDNR